jgi:hypothetical protein
LREVPIHVPEHTAQQVPLLIRLKQERSAAAFHSTFEALWSHQLALSLLEGEIEHPKELIHWLEERTGRFPDPCRMARAADARALAHMHKFR